MNTPYIKQELISVYHFQVGQSYVSSILSTLESLVCCLRPVLSHQPQLLLVNGPGTCLPVALITWLLHASRLSRCRIIFVESLCRVKTLSLTGKILQVGSDNLPHIRLILQLALITDTGSETKYLSPSIVSSCLKDLCYPKIKLQFDEQSKYLGLLS